MNTSLNQWILDATVYGSATILIVLALAPLVRRWLGAQAAHALWLIVLVRLVVPWSSAWDIPRVPIEPPRWNAPASPFANARVSVSVGDASTPNTPPKIPIAPVRPPTNWPLTLWAGGALAMLAFLALRAARAARLVHRARDITSNTLIQHLLTEIGAHPRKLRVHETRDLQSPALCGLIRPTILLPTGWADQMTSTELRHILSHEYGHLRRGDLWWKSAFQLAIALHWFNPLVWLAARLARADQEMACDEWVLSHHTDTNIFQYGNTLISTSRRLNHSTLTSPVHAGMAETKAGLTRRIRQIARHQTHGWKATFTSASLIILLWFSFGPAQTNAESAASPATQFAVTPTPRPTPASSPHPKYTQVEIEAKFLSIPTDLVSRIFGEQRKPILRSDDFQKLLSRLNQTKAADMLSTPSVTTKSGQRATIQIVREFRYPTEMAVDSNRNNLIVPTEFETTPLGVTLEVEPYIAPNGTIMCSLNPRVSDFVGFVNYGGGFPARPQTRADALSAVLQPSGKTAQVINQPVFETSSTSVSVALQSGETVVLGDLGANKASISGVIQAAQDRWTQGKTLKTGAEESNGQQNELYAFITARLVDPEEMARAARAAAAAPTPPLIIDNKSGLPLGTAVPGKPGYVTSPFAPTSGYVDLRGFPSGAEVKCPYTGRLFLVP